LHRNSPSKEKKEKNDRFYLSASVTAVSIGFFHTILGPDHYLPFVVLSESKKWSLKKTMSITFLCGLGHVIGSVVLGFAGIAIGISISKIVAVESFPW
jgi:nickel/cobalt transporter (NicO) family protein